MVRPQKNLQNYFMTIVVSFQITFLVSLCSCLCYIVWPIGLELCYILLMMVMVGNLRKVEGYYDRMLMTLKLISSVAQGIAHLIWLLL